MTPEFSIPYVINEEVLKFNCYSRELQIVSIGRDENGECFYYWPDKGDVLLRLECVDSLLLIVWVPLCP